MLDSLIESMSRCHGSQVHDMNVTRRLSKVGSIVRSTDADAESACSGPWSRHATPTMKPPIHTASGGDLRPAIFVASLSV